jgi:hypothetical protein
MVATKITKSILVLSVQATVHGFALSAEGVEADDVGMTIAIGRGIKLKTGSLIF